jgi:hypothetical protein
VRIRLGVRVPCAATELADPGDAVVLGPPGGVPCVEARSLARRWGASRRAPRRIGAYRCFAHLGRATCTAGSAQVRFRYGRRSA